MEVVTPVHQRPSLRLTTLGYLIAFLMAIGAVFGALNTMYSAVAARTREIATLRALGFGRGAVVVSLLIESLLLAARLPIAAALRERWAKIAPIRCSRVRN